MFESIECKYKKVSDFIFPSNVINSRRFYFATLSSTFKWKIMKKI